MKIFDPSTRYATILVFSHTFVGLSLFYIHAFHASSVFEYKYNFSHLDRIQRELVFQSEHSLYFSFYKRLVQADNFSIGYQQLLNDDMVEYPSTINSVKKFDIYPEIFIGYLYTKFRNITSELGIRTVTCFAIGGDETSEAHVSCEGLGEPIIFYLEITWHIGGLTVFLLYMYGTYLNRSFLGGLSTVVYFFIIHNDATRAHNIPSARENFAFPFIIWQFFYLTLSIERFYYVNENVFQFKLRQQKLLINLNMFIQLTVLTSISLLLWQFSSIIFASQIVAVFLLLQFNMINLNFIYHYAMSQGVSNILVSFIKYNNRYYLVSFHNILTIALLFYTMMFHMKLVREYTDILINEENADTPTSNSTTGTSSTSYNLFHRARNFINNLFVFFSFTVGCLDIFKRMGVFDEDENKTEHYFDLVLANLHLKPPTFNTILYLIDENFSYIDMQTIKTYNNIFFMKYISMFLVIFLARFIHQRRYRNDKINLLKKTPAGVTPVSAGMASSVDVETIDRIKNYLLEDFLEENHIKINELINYEPEYNRELEVLKNKYNYDYEAFKKGEKGKSGSDEKEEKINFLNDIRKLKDQISRNDKKSALLKSNIESLKKLKGKSKPKKDTNSSATTTTTTTTTATTTNQSSDSIENKSNKTDIKMPTEHIIRPHYFYNLLQTILLMVMASLVMKLKYILTPVLCLIASTIPPKYLFFKKDTIYWIAMVFLLLSDITNPGVKNLSKQYTHEKRDTSKFEELLKWIDLNTESNAVFAGPMDVTPTILMVNHRPVVNHPHHETSDMAERTELVYSIFSRKQSSEIYNNLAKLKVQYVVIPFKQCFQPTSVGWMMSSIWDYMDPENKKNSLFCDELFKKNSSGFLIVFMNDKFVVIKIFSHSIELELKKVSIPEYNI